MQERDSDRLLNLVGDLVHGVGAQHDDVRAARLQIAGLAGEQLRCPRPFTCDLQLLDLGEVD